MAWTPPDDYSLEERQEMIIEYKRQLRVKRMSEREFMYRLRRLGLQPVEIDQEMRDAKR